MLAAGRTGAQCDDPGAYCREVPDVAADADPTTGYVIYCSGGSIDQPAGWQAIGGTSAAVPVWAALMALADASKACAAGPLGFAGPALYRAAGNSYAGNFNDVRSGNNDFTGTSGGAYGARAGYDEASGLGTPNAAPLAGALCADTLSLVNPGTLRLTAHASVSLARAGQRSPRRGDRLRRPRPAAGSVIGTDHRPDQGPPASHRTVPGPRDGPGRAGFDRRGHVRHHRRPGSPPVARLRVRAVRAAPPRRASP